MSASTGTGWAQLRQQARSLETQVTFYYAWKVERRADFQQTETLFHTYSQYSAVPNIPAKATEDERNTETQLETILEKV